jgi:uncharacterized Tic20 family protein
MHLRVTDHDRDQVVEHIKAAYAEGRLEKDEMDERLGQAMNARTHAELAPLMHDLYGVRPMAPRAPAAPPVFEAPPQTGGDRMGAAAAHLLAVCGLVVVGPLIMLLTGGKTSPYIRRHAMEALNFQLTVLGATILLPFTIVGVILIPVIWVAFFFLSVVGGLAALGDGGFRYPLTYRLIK